MGLEIGCEGRYEFDSELRPAPPRADCAAFAPNRGRCCCCSSTTFLSFLAILKGWTCIIFPKPLDTIPKGAVTAGANALFGECVLLVPPVRPYLDPGVGDPSIVPDDSAKAFNIAVAEFDCLKACDAESGVDDDAAEAAIDGGARNWDVRRNEEVDAERREVDFSRCSQDMDISPGVEAPLATGAGAARADAAVSDRTSNSFL